MPMSVQGILLSTLFLAYSLGSYGQPAQLRLERPSGPGGGLGGGPIAQVPDTAAEVVQAQECSTRNVLPFGLFQMIMSDPDLLRVEFANEQKTQVKVRMPSYFTACIEELGLKVDFRDNNLYLRAEMDKDYGEYVGCLQSQGYAGADGSINYAQIAQTLNEPTVHLFDVKDFNVDKNMAVIFESPLPDDQNGRFPAVFGHADPPTSECFQNELIKEDGFNLHVSRENVAADWAYDVCTSQDYEKILEGLAALENSTLGNAALLRDVLREALEKEMAKRVDVIHARLERINEMFAPSEGDDEVGVSETQARRLANEYRTLLRELDDILLQPSKEKLTRLIEEYDETIDDDKRDALEEEIKMTTDAVKEYGQTRHEHFYKGLEEYALVGRARDIEEIRQKSIFYERIYAGHPSGRGRRLSPDTADREVEKKLKTFDGILNDWSLAYRAKKGDKDVLKEQSSRVQMANNHMNRSWSRYQRRERDMQKRLCGRRVFGFGVKNPSGCRHFLANTRARSARAMRIREKNHARVARAEDNYNKYSRLYEEYNEESAEDALGGNDPYGYYSADYEFSGGLFYDGGGAQSLPPMGPMGMGASSFGGSSWQGQQGFGPPPMMGMPPGAGFTAPMLPQHGAPYFGGGPPGMSPMMGMPPPGAGFTAPLQYPMR